MPEPQFPKAILKSPLSDDTKNERRNLLVASAIGIIIVKTGLIPTKISALGIEFSQTDKTMLLKILAWIMIYLTISFSIYALSDFVSRVVDVFLSNAEYAKQTYKEITDGIKEQLKIKEEQEALIRGVNNKELTAEDRDKLVARAKEMGAQILASQAEVEEKEKIIRLRKLSKLLFVPRLLLDYLVPLAAGVTTIIFLFRGH